MKYCFLFNRKSFDRYSFLEGGSSDSRRAWKVESGMLLYRLREMIVTHKSGYEIQRRQPQMYEPWMFLIKQVVRSNTVRMKCQDMGLS